jgi:hypothetical protein
MVKRAAPITIRPMHRAVVRIVLLTSFVWALGIAAIIDSPTFYAGYLTLILAGTIIFYVATEKVVITAEKVIFYRYFIKISEGDIGRLRAVEAKVGTPRILSGLAILEDGRRIAEIVSSNYSPEALARLKDGLNG